MSTTPENPGVGTADQDASRPPRSNSVTPCNPQNPGADEGQTYQEWVAAAAAERVSEFIDKFPYLARLPVTGRDATTLRKDVVEAEVEKLHVDVPGDAKDGFAVRRVDRHDVPTWAEAIYWFLTNRQGYDDGFFGHFEAVSGDNFHVRFHDGWTTEYGKEQQAKNAGAFRQLAGGEYPEDSPARAGESVDGEWGEVATVVCALTATSTPSEFDDLRLEENVVAADGRHDRPLHVDAAAGGRLPPVDHLNAIRDGWTDGAYDSLRNLMEYHYGLSNDEWGFVRGDEPHDGGGDNTCYAHTHPVIAFDIEAADVEASADVIQRDFHDRVIGAYLEENQYADAEAHDRQSVTVKIGDDVDAPAAYASKYLNLGEETEMLEADVETVAWATVTAVSGRQRLARSQRFTEAAEADKCLQDAETEHGGEVRRDRHGRVVCAECGSPVKVDGDTLVEARTGSSQTALTDGGEVRGRDLMPDGPGRKIGVSVGVSPSELEVWKQARRFVESDRRPVEVLSPELVAMEISADSPSLEVVRKALEGEELDGSQRPIYGEGKPPKPPTADLLAVETPAGVEEVSNGGGGADMVDVRLPVDRLWRHTRLQYHGDRGSPPIVCEINGERFVTDNPRTAAAWLHDHGVTEPWHAEVCMKFRGVDWAPVASSPDGVPDVELEDGDDDGRRVAEVARTDESPGGDRTATSVADTLVKLRGVDLEVPKSVVDHWSEVEGRYPAEVVDWYDELPPDVNFCDGFGFVE